MAVAGVACVAAANTWSSRGIHGTQPLWWLGVLAIFAPAAATLLFAKVSRAEAISIVLIAGVALYAVKLLFAPGMWWEFDELLHYRTIDNLLTSHRLFSRNTLLPVSPYFPGMDLAVGAIASLTGLSIVQSGLVLIAVARVLTVLGLFLLFERVAAPSRFVAIATLLYMTSPAFIYFDAQVAYESLALTLALVCLFTLRAAQRERGTKRQWLNALGALLLVTVIITHHVSAFILVTTLGLWTLVELVCVLRERKRAGSGLWFDAKSGEPLVYLVDLPGSAWVPAVGVVSGLLWLVYVAATTVSYLWPLIQSGLTEIVRIVRFEETGRKLFESNGGPGAPILERAIGIGSVLIITYLIVLGIRNVWNRPGSHVFARFLAFGSLAYPATLALRFTRTGWEVGSRATAFVYVSLAFTLAAGIETLMSREPTPRFWRRLAFVAAACLILAGGIVAVTSPTTRQPAPYDPGLAWAPYDVESFSDSQWAARVLGPNHRFAADNASGVMIGSVGEQELVTSRGSISISQLFLSPFVDVVEKEIIRRGGIEYVLVDQRIAGAVPRKGFIYEKWERTVQPYGSSVSSTTVNKFDVLRDTSKVFDSGHIKFYELHRLVQ